MTMAKKNVLFLILTLILLFRCAPKMVKKPLYDYSGMTREQIKVHKKIEKFITVAQKTGHPLKLSPRTRIDSLRIDKKRKQLVVDFNKAFSYTALRPENVARTYSLVKELLGRKYRDYRLVLRSLQVPIRELIPNFFRKSPQEYDLHRLARPAPRPPQLVRPVRDWQAPAGLQGMNVAVWNSHGWYFNRSVGRWEWQRPRLFETVEDLLSTSFVLPYLVPMLENAGANVFLPRERDVQTHQVVVDNDGGSGGQSFSEQNKDAEHQWQTGEEPGFAVGSGVYPDSMNPFRLGTYRRTMSDTVVTASVIWTPDIPASGEYAVYISFHAADSNVTDARYTVRHAGGESAFLVNQQIGGSTWVYLGTFKFLKGLHPETGSVVLTNQSAQAGLTVTADAVRFGGGMGNVAREGKVSGRPRFIEGARYYLQYAGFPDSLVYDLNGGRNDYKDDYQGRPEFVNYLKGAPFGPNGHRQAKGLGIPVDVSLAFHTDAGIARGDTVIGTLAIYSVVDADTEKVFPDSVSRLANRDLADLVQTQVVNDVRATLNPQWNRRSLLDATYSEAYRPNVPAMILELLSHQNFNDMRFALDPRFRFVAARAVYKGILRFLATQYGRKYVVQPLPVTHFCAQMDTLGRAVLRWKPQADPLEPGAGAEKYLVCTRVDSFGFDDGRLVSEPRFVSEPLQPGRIYSFKVYAVNAGGRSFPSEILSVCRLNDARPLVVIVNGFDRVAPPQSFNWNGMSGFLNMEDGGVPDRFDVAFTGNQFDFNDRSPFRMNDAPGHGASYADFETKIIPGNTFDFVYVHGKAIASAGHSFVSCSDEAVMAGMIDLTDYRIADIILGEEKEDRQGRAAADSSRSSPFKTFPAELAYAVRKFAQNGGRFFVSGAYVGTDLFAGRGERSWQRRFGEDILRIYWVTDHAARTGRVSPALNDSLGFPTIQFNSGYHPRIYTVEAPDAINPINGSRTILRYAENGFSAATAYSGAFRNVVFGFPFETILSEQIRTKVMQVVLNFLSKD